MQNEFSVYFNLLVNRKSPIIEATQIEIMEYLFDTFVQYNKDLLLISNGYISPVRSRVAFETMAHMQLRINFPDAQIKSFNEDKNTYKWNLKIHDIYDTLTTINTYSLLRYESDLFAPKQTVIKNHQTSTITVITNTLHIKEPQQEERTKEEDVEYVEITNDYKRHFPHFDDLLKLIIDMRFAKDRKASFVHLRVKSNWGKSFLSGLLKNIEIGFEIDYHNLMNKGASDIAPIQVRNSFVMILDEFNNFSAEMKKLSHSFAFAPKFGMREEVELYLKILMSAEKSPSFAGGVDSQIVNRVMVMDVEDSDAVKLTDREIYRKHGNAKYMRALEVYAYLQISEHLFNYLEREKFEAHREADVSVGLALEKFKMKDVENLNDTTKSVINSMIEEILDSSDIELNPKFREIKANIIMIDRGKYKGKVFIKAPLRTFEIILKNSTSESEYKKMKYKLSDVKSIVNLVMEYNDSKFSVNGGKQIKGLVIDIEDKKSHSEILKDLEQRGSLIFD